VPLISFFPSLLLLLLFCSEMERSASLLVVLLLALALVVCDCGAAGTWGAPGPRGQSNITACTFTTTDNYTYSLAPLIATYVIADAQEIVKLAFAQ
jgi:hypothetical protein